MSHVRGSTRRHLDEQRAEVEYHPVPTEHFHHVHHHAASPERSWGVQLLESPTFQNIMGAVIIANGAVIGLETDIPEFPYWSQIEAAFLSIFIAEVGFKIYVEGSLFFHPLEADFLWNIFDFVIVGLGVFDITASLLGFTASSGGFATIFRMVRLLRVLRILRLLKILKRLYLLAVGLVEACKAIIWVTLLMSTVLYVLSIVLVKTVGSTATTDPNYEFLATHFRDIPDSMITLFVLMSSPNLPIYQEEDGLLNSRPFFCLFLIIFITFGSFGMIAMLTGVINESMFENNELKKEEKREVHEAMRAILGKRSVELYETLPLDNKGCARTSDLQEIAEPAALLLDQTGVQIAHGDILKFLTLMDEDESGTIDMKEFVSAIEKIAEGLSPLAILEVQHYVGLCNKRMLQQVEHVGEIEDQIKSVVMHVSEEVERMLAVLVGKQSEHKTHVVESIQSLVEKMEFQMERTSREVDRILEVIEAGQGEHRSHRTEIFDKLEGQLQHTSDEVDRILEVLTNEELRDVRPPVGDRSTQVAGVQSLSQIQRCESRVLTAVSKQTQDVTTSLQSIIDKKFSDLERKLEQMDVSNLGKEAVPQVKLEEVPWSVQHLNKKEDVTQTLRAELSRQMQESKNSVVQIAKVQEATSENVKALTSKVSNLEKESDYTQTQLLSSVAELGGDLITSVSDLLSKSMATMKQELVYQRFHALSALSREEAKMTLMSSVDTRSSFPEPPNSQPRCSSDCSGQPRDGSRQESTDVESSFSTFPR